MLLPYQATPGEGCRVCRSSLGGRLLTRFIQGHELGHHVVSWHEGAFVDDEQRLFRETEEILELEASLAGADLFFQGKPFFERAVEYPVSLKTPLLLARTFKASLHATIHYYIEHHPEPVAGLIAGQYPRMEGTVPVGQRCYFVDARTADAASLWAPDQGSGELTESRDHLA